VRLPSHPARGLVSGYQATMRSTLYVVLALTSAAVVSASASAWAGKSNRRLTDEERGALLYERHCIQCHGLTGGGDGPATEDLVHEVPDLRGELSKDNREAHAEVVLVGKGAMPGFHTSFDRYDARRVLRYLEALPDKVLQAEAQQVEEEARERVLEPVPPAPDPSEPDAPVDEGHAP